MMARILIPIDPNVVSQRFLVDLDGITYQMQLDWNDRSQHWYVSLYDINDVVLIQGRKLAVNWNPFFGVTFDQQPKGNLYLWDTEQSNRTISRDSYGGDNARVKLYYNDTTGA